MSPVQVITVLLPLITLAMAQNRNFQTADDVEATKIMTEINGMCKVTPVPAFFCMGAKGKDASFAGDGCLKNMDCEAIIFAQQLTTKPDDKEAPTIRWTFVVPTGSTTMFYLSKATTVDKKVPPNTVFNQGNPKFAYTDKDSKVMDLPNIDTAYTMQKNINSDGKTILTFTSQNVIEYAKINYKVDAVKDELFPTLIKNSQADPTPPPHQPTKAMKLFGDPQPPTGGDGNPQTTAPPGNTTSPTVKPSEPLPTWVIVLAILLAIILWIVVCIAGIACRIWCCVKIIEMCKKPAPTPVAVVSDVQAPTNVESGRNEVQSEA